MPESFATTITLLFTDVEGSTQLLRRLPDQYPRFLSEIQELLRIGFEQYHGRVVDTQGDSFFAAFPRALDAVNAVVATQRALAAHDWGKGIQVRVRMGLHTGEPTVVGSKYMGIAVHYAARIGAAGFGGQVLLSETTRALVESDLPQGVTLRDLGEHRLKDFPSSQHLYQLVIAGLDSDFPPLATRAGIPNNLPFQLTSFIGREREVGEITRLLASTRLVTLTGSGGAGKTRLALKVAADALEAARFQDGVWMIELAPVSNPEIVNQTVATVLNLRDESGNLLQTLSSYLSRREILLVFDNCEHLIDICAQLIDTLLRAAPHLKILATSREGLNLQGEFVFGLPSLPLPDGRTPISVETLLQSDAARLFVERATAAYPDFRVTDTNAAHIAQVCRRLDGIPLAIELAAARVKAFTVEQIAARLDDVFRLLTGGSRTALPRQQTMAAAVNWSYQLLSAKERLLLGRLAVFASGWTLEAAEAVGGGDAIQDFQVFDLLAQLVNKSLVVADHAANEGVRYRFLETIRQFARYRLYESKEVEAVTNRYLGFFVPFAERAGSEFHGPNQVEWLQRLDLEHDNLRAALTWALAENNGDAERALRLIGGLGLFWDIRGNWLEGLDWCERALNATTAPTPGRVRTLIAAGGFASRLTDLRRAEVFTQDALALARKLGARREEAEALFALGLFSSIRGDIMHSSSLLEESLSLYQELGDRWGIAHALGPAAQSALDRREYRRAAGLYRASLALFREVGDRHEVAGALGNLAEVVSVQGNLIRAQTLAQESLEIYRELEDKHGIATALKSLGRIARERGKVKYARELLTESIALFSDMGDRGCCLESTVELAELLRQQGENTAANQIGKQNLATAKELGWSQGIFISAILLARVSLMVGQTGRARVLLTEVVSGQPSLENPIGVSFIETCAAFAFAQEQPVFAVRALGTAQALRERIGVPFNSGEQSDRESLENQLRAKLGEERFAHAWASGHSELVSLTPADYLCA